MPPRLMCCGLFAVLMGCGTSGSAVDLPLISPPVRAATPAGLATPARLRDAVLAP